MNLSGKQLKKIHILAHEIGMDRITRVRCMIEWYGVNSSKNLTVDDAINFISRLQEIQMGTMQLAFTSDGEPFVQTIEKENEQ